jgi:hypothetical protein
MHDSCLQHCIVRTGTIISKEINIFKSIIYFIIILFSSKEN